MIQHFLVRLIGVTISLAHYRTLWPPSLSYFKSGYNGVNVSLVCNDHHTTFVIKHETMFGRYVFLEADFKSNCDGFHVY